MAYDVGARIGIDGEKEFRTTIKAIESQMKSFGTELKAVTAEFAANEKSEDALTKKNEVLQKSVGAAEQKLQVLGSQLERGKSKLDELGKALEDATREFGENSSEAGKAQNAYNRQVSELNNLQSKINTTTATLNDFRNQICDNNTALDDLKNGTNEAADAMDDAGQSASNFGDFLKAALLSDVIIGAVETIRDAVLELGQALMEYSTESENATKKATAYFGETGAEAEKTAALIKDVYTSGVGDGLDSVSNAVIEVKKNLQDLSETDLKNITQQAITLDELYGIDMSETLRGVNSLMNQFRIDAQTAMDYIVTGTQNGLDKTNELGDNIAEYAGKFAQAGYSAEEYFQLLNNGLDGGAYNLDKVNDAINEVTTRLADDTIGDAISIYSKETQSLFQEWKKGGATQKQVIDSIVADIRSCSNQQEALNMAAQAFGTMAEDGNLKFIESLTSVGTAYDDVSGKAQQFFDSTTTNQQNAEASIRQMQEALKPIGDILNMVVAETLPLLAEGITNLASQIDWESVTNTISSIIQGVMEFAGFITETFAPAFQTLAPVADALFSAFSNAVQTVLPAVQGAFAEVAETFTWLGEILGTILPPIIEFFVSLSATHLQAFLSVVQVVFGTINTIINTVMNTIVPAVTGGFENIKTAISTSLNFIANLISTIWNTIVSTVGGAISEIVNTVSVGVNSVKTSWTNALNSIKSTASSIFNNIKSMITTVINNVVSTVSSGMKKAGESIKTGLQSGIDFVSGLPSKFLQWGKDMIGSLIDGITSKIGGVKEAIGNIADTIREFIHFSEPDVGPLSDFHTYMPDMIKTLTTGIRAGIPEIRSAMTDLSTAMIPVNSNGTAAAYDRLSSQLSGMQIVLDDGTLVGKMAPKIDVVMGGYAQRKGRYNV